MKDALVAFCGCLQMSKVLTTTTRTRMQTITMLHASTRARASRAWVKVTHSATRHATEEK